MKESVSGHFPRNPVRKIRQASFCSLYLLLLQYFSHFDDETLMLVSKFLEFFPISAWKRTNDHNFCPLENKRKKLSSREQKDRKGRVDRLDDVSVSSSLGQSIYPSSCPLSEVIKLPILRSRIAGSYRTGRHKF